MTSLSPAINAAISDAVSKYHGDPVFLTPLMTSRVVVRDDASGRPEVVVLDASGTPQTTWRDGRPVPATIDDFVKGLKANPTYAPAFGSGNSDASTSKPGVTTLSATDWLNKTSAATPAERTALFRDAAAGKYKIGN